MAGYVPPKKGTRNPSRSSLPTPRLYITAVASLGVAPANHDEDTCWLSSDPAVAVPVLPSVGHSVRPRLPVPAAPEFTTFCSAATAWPGTSDGIDCSFSISCLCSVVPFGSSTLLMMYHSDFLPPAASVAYAFAMSIGGTGT